MKLIDHLNKHGATSDLARELGVTAVTVYQWKEGIKQVPAARCPAIEEATGGLVTCEELRPDVNWAVLRKPRMLEAA